MKTLENLNLNSTELLIIEKCQKNMELESIGAKLTECFFTSEEVDLLQDIVGAARSVLLNEYMDLWFELNVPRAHLRLLKEVARQRHEKSQLQI